MLPTSIHVFKSIQIFLILLYKSSNCFSTNFKSLSGGILFFMGNFNRASLNKQKHKLSIQCAQKEYIQRSVSSPVSSVIFFSSLRYPSLWAAWEQSWHLPWTGTVGKRIHRSPRPHSAEYPRSDHGTSSGIGHSQCRTYKRHDKTTELRKNSDAFSIPEHFYGRGCSLCV